MSAEIAKLPNLLRQLSDLIQAARRQALRAVDTLQVRTCREIGRHIVEFEQQGANRATYDARLISTLAESLTVEFGRGFDERNLRHMRSFFQGFPIWNPVRTELSWSHFYIDLVFYNCLLKCFVLFDLKAGELTHQDIGQMDMYVRMMDDAPRPGQ